MSLHLQRLSNGALRIFHPTDFSEASEVAFVHALKLTLLSKGILTIWHLDAPDTEYLHWSQYPRVRQTLHRWGLVGSECPPQELARLGIRIEKIQTMGRHVVSEMLDEFDKRQADLMVLATHRHSGLDQLLHRAIAEPMARRSHTSTLFIPEGSTGFVDGDHGNVNLKHVLVPFDRSPAPQAAVDFVAGLPKLLGGQKLTVTAVHIGEDGLLPSLNLPTDDSVKWEKLVLQGDILERIHELAVDRSIDLIVLTTAGHHGYLDALRGSTSERILHSVMVPVLAIPVAE